MVCSEISTTLSNVVIKFDKTDRSEGTVATATCLSGYSLVGESSLTCRSGQWNNDIPECVIKQCSSLTVDHAEFSTSLPVNHGTDVTVSCVSGYKITAGDSTLTCNGDTNGFDGVPPTCTMSE